MGANIRYPKKLIMRRLVLEITFAFFNFIQNYKK